MDPFQKLESAITVLDEAGKDLVHRALELAKLAGSPGRPKASSVSGLRPAARRDENDSGMIDLEVLASIDPGAADRASVTPLASATS